MKLLNTIKKLIPKKIFSALQPVYHFLLSGLSALFYGFPSNNLIIIGVTGTTGKTTSVYMIAKALESAGIKTGFTSTAMFNDGEKEWMNDKKMTMIGRFFTQRILKKMHVNGCRVAIIETTSEGIKQYRHRFINYDITVFTGLYEEHIEAHGSFLKYKEAKGELFRHLGRCGEKYVNEKYEVKKALSGLGKTGFKKIKKTIIVNGNDKHADYFLKFPAERKIAYVNNGKNVQFTNVEILKFGDIMTSEHGTAFTCGQNKINLQLLGDFNAVNAMNAVGVGSALDLPSAGIKSGLENIKGIAGRLEKIDEGQDYTIIVDYAFEPGAVEKLYKIVKTLKPKRVIHVLGSTGGGRDLARRPILGELAGLNADMVIVTNEDPYDDDPALIIDQVALGAERAGKKKNQDLFLIIDRRDAIKKALDSAKAQDIVLITGKGNEQAICVADGEKIPWDDRAVVRGLLA